MKRTWILFISLLLLCGCGKEQSKQTKIVKYCENGTPIYNEDMTDIEKCEVVETIDATKISCEDENFKFNNETKKCENILSIPANHRIGCRDEENYELRNGACHPKDGKGGVKYRVNIYSCPSNATLNKDKCELVDQQDALIECSEGYEANVDKAVCEKKSYIAYSEMEE